jgi:hypothetical protein
VSSCHQASVFDGTNQPYTNQKHEKNVKTVIFCFFNVDPLESKSFRELMNTNLYCYSNLL